MVRTTGANRRERFFACKGCATASEPGRLYCRTDRAGGKGIMMKLRHSAGCWHWQHGAVSLRIVSNKNGQRLVISCEQCQPLFDLRQYSISFLWMVIQRLHLPKQVLREQFR